MGSTHNGDRGKTLLASPTPVSKDDIRLEAIGTLDELAAILRLAAIVGNGPRCPTLLRILDTLSRLSEYVTTGGKATLLPHREELLFLEEGISRLTPPAEPVGIALSEESARLYQAVAVARRAERTLVRVGRVYPMQEAATAYLNRLSDWLTALAKRADHKAAHTDEATAPTAAVPTASTVNTDGIVRAVLAELGERPMLELTEAKRLIEAVEERAMREGRRVVVAVANAAGAPIAVHVMDGAYLVSFDVAIKKAYSAAAVRISTKELGALVAKGGTFQGLDRIEELVTFGGGIPLFRGDLLVGAIGVSGGTGDEDHALAEYAKEIFASI